MAKQNAKGLGNSYFLHPAVAHILQFKTGLRENMLFFINRDPQNSPRQQ